MSEEPDFKEYPVYMVHPHAKKAQSIPIPGSQQYDARGNVTRQDYQGTVEKFPPILAHNEDQEGLAMQQGYVRGGKSSPEAFARGIATPTPPDYKPARYPCWVKGVLCQNEDEEEEVLTRPDPEPEPEPEPIVVGEVGDMGAILAAMREMQAELAELRAARRPGRPRKDAEAA